MKKAAIIVSLLIISTIAKAQQNGAKVNLFGTTNYSITELDKGAYKEYIICFLTSDDTIKQSFTIYNDETPMFYDRFQKAYDSLEANKSVFKRGQESLETKARIAYLRLRNAETVSVLSEKANSQPEAGLLIIEDNMNIQRVNPSLHKQIKNIVKYRFKLLKKNDENAVTFYTNNDNLNLSQNTTLDLDAKQSETTETQPDTTSTKSRSNANQQNYWQEIKFKSRSNKKNSNIKYLELLNDTIYNRYSRGCKQKRLLKDRFYSIIVDSIKAKEKKSIIDIKNNITSINSEIAAINQRNKDLKKRMQEHRNKLDENEYQLKVLDNDKAFLLSADDEYWYKVIISDLNLNTDTTNALLEELKSSGIDLDPLIKRKQEFYKMFDRKTDSLEKALYNANKSIDSIDAHMNAENSTSIKADEYLLNKTQEQVEKLTKKVDTTYKMLNDSIEEDFQRKLKFIKAKKSRNTATSRNNEVTANTPEDYIEIVEKNIVIVKKNIEEDLNEIVINLKKVKNKQKNRETYCNKYYNHAIKELFQKLLVDSIQIEFNDGSIENLQVIGRLSAAEIDSCRNKTSESLKFNNLVPYGFTSKKEVDLLNNRWLFTDGANGFFYKLNVGQLFEDYIEKYEVDRRDFSPKNQVIDLKKNDPKVFNSEKKKFYKKLYKDYTTDIISGTVFTDLAGIPGNEPNGLIQTEFYKDLAVNKNRYFPGRVRESVRNYNLRIKQSSVTVNFGFLAYLKPYFVLSKIENDNKYLNLSLKETTTNGITDSIYYSSTINLRKHQSFKVGVNTNIGLMDIPEWKSTFFLDYDFYWGGVPVSLYSAENDQIEEFSANSIEHGPRLAWELFTDERYGFRLEYGLNFYHTFNQQFIQVAYSQEFAQNTYSTSSNGDYYYNYGTHVFDFLAFIKPNSDGRGKLFFQYRFTAKAKLWNSNWSQVQIGFAFTFTKTTIPNNLKE